VSADPTVSPIARLGHVALRTPDLERSVAFFDHVVGLELVERDERAAYLRAWGDFEHHTLALVEGEEGALDHVGWRTRSAAHLEALLDRLRRDGFDLTEVSGVEPGQGPAFQFRTPSGLPYELYFEVEKRRPTDAPAIKTNSGPVWGHGISPRRIDHVNFVAEDVAAERAWSESVLGFRTHEYVS
jgi:catechol 2,3-dioxygenase